MSPLIVIGGAGAAAYFTHGRVRWFIIGATALYAGLFAYQSFSATQAQG